MFYKVHAFSLRAVAQFEYLCDAMEYAKTQSETSGAVKYGVEWNVTQIAFEEGDEPIMPDGLVACFTGGKQTFAAYAYSHSGGRDAAVEAYAKRGE